MMRFSSRGLFAAGLLLAAAAQGQAADRLGIMPGMSLAEVDAVLKAKCPSYAVSGDAERFVVCLMGENPEASEIRVTISPNDRAYYIAWHETAPSDVLAYTQQVAGELGFSGEGKTCKFYDYELRCWKGRNGTVLYSGERDARQRYVSYLVNETIETEDAAPQ